MKLSFLLLTVATFQLSAFSIYSQNEKLSLKMKDASIVDVLDFIEEQTDLQFFYQNEQLASAAPVNVEAENQTIDVVLDAMLENADLDFRIVDKHVVIFPDNSKSEAVANARQQDQQDQQEVSGTVTDQDGEPIPGVSITVKGDESTGTISDVDGTYVLSGVSNEDILIFSFVGMKDMERQVDGDVLDVQMEEDVIGLDEVVAVGYGTQQKKNLTGSVSNVDMEGMESQPVTNSSLALQGKATGVYALQTQGKPGDNSAILNIRGLGTLNNSSPLVLIDDVPGDINDVNPRNIESISVLKDAASSAIYGNRAAHGVILITTKTGKEGKMTINYNGHTGIQEATALPSVLNSAEYATLKNEAAINSGQQPEYTEEEIQKFKDGDDWQYPDVNWFDVMYEKATLQEHQLNLSGGSETLQYNFGLGYLDQDGILLATEYERVDFQSNFDAYLLDDDLHLSAKILGKRGDRLEPYQEWEVKWYATNAPVWPVKNPDGEYIAINGEQNYYGETKEGGTNQIITNDFQSQFKGEYEVFDGLSLELTYGFNYEYSHNNSFKAGLELVTMGGSTKNVQSGLTENFDENKQTLLTSLARYDKDFGIHGINLVAGYSEEEFTGEWTNAYRNNFINNRQRYLTLGDPSSMENDGGGWDLGYQSYFGRLNYNFDDRYLFEANIRKDGSSRFAEGNRWGTFPSFSAAWRVAEEPFMGGLDWLTNLKFRASWGQLGNQEIGTYYAGRDVLNVGYDYPAGGSLKQGVAITSMSNEDVTWETTEQFNVGLDLGINDVNMTLDYFRKETSDILMQVPIPFTMGNLDPPFSNVGGVSNNGLEFSLSHRKSFSEDFNIRSNLNLTYTKNEITDLGGRSPIISSPTAYVEGHPINSFYGYESDGLYQISDFTWQDGSDEDIPHQDRQYELKEDVVTLEDYTPQPGDLKYKDLNGDNHVSTEDDRKVIGDQNPDLQYSFNLGGRYKQFDLNLFFQGVYGINGYTSAELVEPFNNFFNTASWWKKRWTPENPDEDYPRLTLDDSRRQVVSDFYMEDASYLRLKNIELGYTLNQDLTSLIGFKRLRVYGSIRNAFTITNFKGFDPEQPPDALRAQPYPQVRIMTLGLNANF